MHAVASPIHGGKTRRNGPRAPARYVPARRHAAVDGRGRIGRTAGDVINLGQQKRLIEGDDAAVVRWRQTDAKRLVREAPSDDLAQLRPQRDVERALRARTRGAGASG